MCCSLVSRALIFLSSFLLLAMAGCQTAPSLAPTQTLLITIADTTSITMPQRGYHRNRYSISQGTRRLLQQIELDHTLRQVDGWPIRVLGVYCAIMALPVGMDQQAMLSALQRDHRIQLAQPLQTFMVEATVYNDPYFDVQYRQQAKRILALHRQLTGRGKSIAIIDTGIDRKHPDLRDARIVAQNFVNHDTQFDQDIHGTALAGIIVSHPNNSIGLVGLAPEAKLLALKACWQIRPRHITAQCNSFTLAKAMAFAIDQQVDVINLSLTGPVDPLLRLLVQKALAFGTVVVAAQNNVNAFPASEPGVLAVSRLPDESLTLPLWIFSDDVLSTSPGGGYDFFHGVSLRTAQVSALAALLKQHSPDSEILPTSTHDLQLQLTRSLAATTHD